MGALLYELLIGLPPFYSQDPEEIYEAVLVEELSYPNDVSLSSECRNLLKALLCKDPKKRLGNHQFKLGSLYGTK
jgi:serum/glucocorticoid-regulated kinase 2